VIKTKRKKANWNSVVLSQQQMEKNQKTKIKVKQTPTIAIAKNCLNIKLTEKMFIETMLR